MDLAIAELETRLSIVEANEPINRSAGKVEQADLEVEVAASIRKAISVLRSEHS